MGLTIHRDFLVCNKKIAVNFGIHGLAIRLYTTIQPERNSAGLPFEFSFENASLKRYFFLGFSRTLRCGWQALENGLTRNVPGIPETRMAPSDLK